MSPIPFIHSTDTKHVLCWHRYIDCGQQIWMVLIVWHGGPQARIFCPWWVQLILEFIRQSVVVWIDAYILIRGWAAKEKDLPSLKGGPKKSRPLGLGAGRVFISKNEERVMKGSHVCQHHTAWPPAYFRQLQLLLNRTAISMPPCGAPLQLLGWMVGWRGLYRVLGLIQSNH